MSEQIRPFVEKDIPQVAGLHNRVWRVAPTLSPELMSAYRDYFTQVFLQQSWPGGPSCSLVHEELDGRITGFLGSLPRRMQMNGAPVQLKVGSQFFVDPERRGFAGIRLAKAFLDGPQDVSVADEANFSARTLWQRLGGTVCSFSSLRWISVLQPCRFGLFALSRTGSLHHSLISGMTPVARLLDNLAVHVPGSPFRMQASEFSSEELRCETLADCLSEAAKRKPLRPEYDIATVKWLLQRASQLQSNGVLRKVLVRTPKGEVAGWYVYYLKPDGLSDVVQLHAKTRFTKEVIDHLFHDAWKRGASALSGRPEACLMKALSDKRCLLYGTGQWVLVHSRCPELVNAFVTGDAFFSRLDGEWCLHFQ